MMNKLSKYTFVLLLVAGISMGCESFLTPSVDQEKPTDDAITDAASLQNAVNGALDYLNGTSLYGRDFPVSLEVSTDNAFSNQNSNRFGTQDQLNYTVNNGYVSGLWNNSYGAIAALNLALQADLESTPEIEDIRGQAFALRGLIHMNLLLSYGQQFIDGGNPSMGIPYITAYNDGNIYPSRNTVDEVWSMIGEDLQAGVDMMNPERFNPVNMNYYAALGLQSRYYLYTEQYEQVIGAAESLINSQQFSITPAGNYVSAWATDPKPGSLFEAAFTSTDRLANDNIARIYRPSNYGDVEVSGDLYLTYDENDVRLDLYGAPGDTYVDPLSGETVTVAGYRMLYKYPDEQGTDNTVIIRYAEVILNYAEALANNNRQPDALAELTKITSNRNVQPYATGTIENVLRERRLELAMEGHRLFDLARTGQPIPIGDDASLRSEVIPAGDYRFALPIPDGEIQANSNIKQNMGYN